jgi:hypothetical protein
VQSAGRTTLPMATDTGHLTWQRGANGRNQDQVQGTGRVALTGRTSGRTEERKTEEVITYRERDDLWRFDHLYNSTAITERGLEIAIAHQYWLHNYYWNEDHPGPSLEVGNVLRHYDITWIRDVVDKYEKGRGVTNIDLFDITERYGLIISISTLEHVGLDYGEGYDETASVRAVKHLRSLLVPGGHLCITIPLGWHPTLNPDELDATHSSYYIRTSKPGHWDSEWIHVGPSLSDVPEPSRVYGTVTPWANAVWVGEFEA